MCVLEVSCAHSIGQQPLTEKQAVLIGARMKKLCQRVRDLARRSRTSRMDLPYGPRLNALKALIRVKPLIRVNDTIDVAHEHDSLVPLAR